MQYISGETLGLFCDVGEEESKVVIEELHVTVVVQPLDELGFHAPKGVRNMTIVPSLNFWWFGSENTAILLV